MPMSRILVIEDDEDMLDLIRTTLERAGLQSDGATSAERGYELMQRHLYQVAVLDIHLPGQSGVQTINALKRLNPLVQVLMLTSDASIERVIDCIDRGACDFFLKTDNLQPLVEAVTAATSRGARWSSWIGKGRLTKESAG